MTAVILEIGHCSGMGKPIIDQYLPVDSVKTGIAIAKEAIKEYEKPGTTIEHPHKQVWFINQHRELICDLIRYVRVKEVEVATINQLKMIKDNQ